MAGGSYGWRWGCHPGRTINPALAALPGDDSELLRLEEQIFKAYDAATEHDEEIERLQQFWKAERERLSFTFRYSDEEAWNLVWSTPEGKEWDLLVNFQEGHLARMGELVEKMWSMPARTEAGRKAKVLVLLGCVIRQNFNLPDEASDYDALITRQLLFELVGSEAGAARAVRRAPTGRATT